LILGVSTVNAGRHVDRHFSMCAGVRMS
jgi:hypothetical protein